MNTILDSVGAISLRNGYTKLLTTKLGSTTTNGIAYYKSDGTKQFVYGAGNTLYRYDNAGGSIAITGGSLNATGTYYFEVFGDTLYGVNGNDFFSYNGTSITAYVTGITNPQYIRVHKNRIWVLSGSRLYFTDAFAGTSAPIFPGNNFIDINTNDSQVGTGLEVLLDQMVIFKTDSVWVITGEPLGSGSSTIIGNLNLRRANSDVGCVAAKSIKKVESYILFAARSGIFVYENFQTRLISSDVNGTFRTDMNANLFSSMWADYNAIQKKYLLGYVSAGSNSPDKVICYDTVVKHFTIWDDIKAGWATNFRFSQSETTLIGDPTQGNIYQLYQGYADIGGDNGTVVAGPGSSTATNTNYITNPSFETGSTGWSAVGAFANVSTGTNAPIQNRTKYLRLAGSSSNDAATYLATGLVPGPNVLSFYARFDTTGAANTPTLTLSGNSVTILTASLTTLTASFVRNTFAFTLPVGVTSMTIQLSVGASTVNNYDAIQLEVGTVATPYFDGATSAGGGSTYVWSGTADASTSIQTTVVAVSTDATHLVDTSRTWTNNQFADAKVVVGLGTSTVTQGTITANGVNSLTVASWSNGVPAVGQPYTIGGYTSYWKSRIFSFDAPQMTKRFKYFSIFTDTQSNYNLQMGAALDFATIGFNLPSISLSSGGTVWDSGVFWDSGLTYDTKGSLYRRIGLPGQGRYIQIMFGNYNSNQPWRVFEYAFTYKNKKDRPSV
jgi:hypothetical protein